MEDKISPWGSEHIVSDFFSEYFPSDLK